MKRLLLLSTLVLCLLLCGCGAEKTPAPTAEPVQTPVPTEVLQPDETLLTLLGEVRDRMHLGTAGSSLRAAALASELLDWAAESTLSPAALRLTADAYLGGLDEAEREEFLQQLQAVDYSCSVLAAAGEQAESLLEDAGCQPKHYPWPQEAVDQVARLMRAVGLSAEGGTDGGLLDEHWFDDALFLGDSLTGSLNIYNIQSGGLGDAVIFHVNGLACHHIIEKDTHFNFKGKSCSIEEAAALSGAGKLFLMLAMNDVGTRPIEQLHEDWALMLTRIQESCPEMAVYVQSGTPLRLDVSYFTRENMADYNQMLREVCAKTGCVYVDITPGLADEDGFLKDEYRLDDMHLNPEGCAVWVENLRRAESYSVPPVTEESAP